MNIHEYSWIFMNIHEYTRIYIINFVYHVFPHVGSWNVCHGQNSHIESSRQQRELPSLAPSHGCGCGSFNISTGLNSLGLAIFTFGACRNLHQKSRKKVPSEGSLTASEGQIHADSIFWRSNPCRFQDFSCMEAWNGLFLLLEASFGCCLSLVVKTLYISVRKAFWSGFHQNSLIAVGATQSSGHNSRPAS